jgi:hypothetical protein
MSNVRFVAALASALLAVSPALAQSPSGAAQPAAPPVSAAAQAAAEAGAAKCGKVDPFPGRTASVNMQRNWNKEATEWQNCVKKYIADTQAKTDAAIKAANELVAETNAAIALYNAAVKDFAAQTEGAK